MQTVTYLDSLNRAAFLRGADAVEFQRSVDGAIAEAARQNAVRVSAPTVAPVSNQWGASMEPCGGDLPPCYVKNRESHGDYSARNNETPSSACGAWQIIQSTWAGFGGYPDACSAPPAVQDAKARELWAGGAGCSHWSAC